MSEIETLIMNTLRDTDKGVIQLKRENKLKLKDNTCQKMQHMAWTKYEADKLDEGLDLFGKDWVKIAKHIGGTKNHR